MDGNFMQVAEAVSVVASRFKVYLAGPIAGLTYDAGQNWREAFADAMPAAIACYSPLRSKAYLRGDAIGTAPIHMGPLSTDRGIMARDHMDCRTADLIVANFLGAERVTIGTAMELAWAFAYGKPVVAIMEPSGNLHDHPMIREAISFRVPCILQAASLVPAVLLP